MTAIVYADTPARPAGLDELLGIVEAFRSAPWRQQAACKGVDVEVFYPNGSVGRDSPAEEAKAICRRCPVRRECAADAKERDETWGIWGGTLLNADPRFRPGRAGVTRAKVEKHLAKRAGQWVTVADLAVVTGVGERSAGVQANALAADGVIERRKRRHGVAEFNEYRMTRENR